MQVKCVHGVDVLRAAALVNESIRVYNQSDTGDYQCIGEFLRKKDKLYELWDLRGIHSCIHSFIHSFIY